MAKRKTVKKDSSKNPLKSIWGFVAWLTGVLVGLAVGSGMAFGVLTIPFLSNLADGLIVEVAGWIVIVLTLLGVLLMLIDKFSN